MLSEFIRFFYLLHRSHRSTHHIRTSNNHNWM